MHLGLFPGENPFFFPLLTLQEWGFCWPLPSPAMSLYMALNQSFNHVPHHSLLDLSLYVTHTLPPVCISAPQNYSPCHLPFRPVSPGKLPASCRLHLLLGIGDGSANSPGLALAWPLGLVLLVVHREHVLSCVIPRTCKDACPNFGSQDCSVLWEQQPLIPALPFARAVTLLPALV